MAVIDTISPLQLSGTPGAPPRRWKWTGDDLIRMGEAGLLPPEGRFELLDGEIYQIMPPGPLHAYLVGILDSLFRQLAGRMGGHVREEKPIRLNAEYDPQPDIAVVRGAEHAYRDRFPGPEDVLLVVEAADSSVQHDRELKLPGYAEAGIPEFWLINLPEARVEVYRDPAGPEYRTRRIYRAGETIEPLGAPGSPVPVTDLLGESQGSADAAG